MKTVSLRLPDSLANRLASVARRSGSTKSTVVRRALESFLASETANGPRRSLADRAAGILGSLEGPGDLSHNSKYLEDLGR